MGHISPLPEPRPSVRVDPDEWPEAIAATEGAQLIVAGPGTGKTEFIVRRAAHLVVDKGLEGGRLLALSFSRRSAGELRDRIEIATGGVAVAAGTFHAFSQRLLETFGATAFGWPSVPALLTGPEQVALIQDLLKSERPADWSVAFRGILGSFTFAEEVTDFILRVFERGTEAATLERLAAGRQDWRGLPAFLDRYRHHLATEHLLDYGTLQLTALDLVQHAAVAPEIADAYQYILVDEYQDTTPTQARFVELLARHTGNVTVAADPYQSIYGFRGTDLSNVKEFEERFADLVPRRLHLQQSFRVPDDILRAAERITAGAALPGGAGPIDPAPHRGRVDVYVFDQHAQESDWIATEVQRLHVEEGYPYRSIAVLVRSTRRFLPELVRSLDRAGVPHDRPGKRLVDHPAVVVLFDVVRAALAATGGASALDRAEGARALNRLLLGPLMSLPLSQQRDLVRQHQAGGVPWPSLLRSIEQSELATLIEDAAWCVESPAAAGLWQAWTGLPGLSRFAEGPAWREHRAALASLSQILERVFERAPDVTLADYMALAEQEDFEATPLLTYLAADTDRLTVTTMHQAKGLEFDAVFIADASEGILPDLRRQRSLLQPEHLAETPTDQSDKIREEMRLAYTAMTRARSRVVWTTTRAGVDELEHRPSRFLLAVAGTDAAHLAPPADTGRQPITPLEAESTLRSVMADPSASESDRLAALTVLVDRPNPALRPAEAFVGTRRHGSDEGILPEMFSLSPSQASRYNECPRRYALERRVGIDTEAGPYAAFGTIIHTALEEAEGTAMREGRHRSTYDETLALAEAGIDTTDFGGGAFQIAWKRRAATLLQRLYDEWPNPDAAPVLLEHPLDRTIAGVPWHGLADRIEKEGDLIRVVDYKTSASTPTKAEAAESIQLGYYLLASQEDPTVTDKGIPAEAEFWYPVGRLAKIAVKFDPKLLHGLEEKLEIISRSISDEDWRPVIGEHCDRCHVRLVCPEWPEGREAYVR